MKSLFCLLAFGLICLTILSVNNAQRSILHHFDWDDKLEIAKKVGAALALSLRSRKFMLPVPFVFPIPIPIYKNYQPVIHDPLFWKLQAKQNLLGGGGIGPAYGGIGAVGGLGIGGFGGIGGGVGGLGGLGGIG